MNFIRFVIVSHLNSNKHQFHKFYEVRSPNGGGINISVVEVDWDIESIDSFYNLFYSSFVLDEGVER